LIGVSLWATSNVLSASAGLIAALPPLVRLAMDWSPAVVGALGLAAVFYFVPNTKVERWHALVGGMVASLGLELGKRSFAAYLFKLPTYKAVYGAFVTLPVFLLWVYFSWIVVLTAALIAANLGRMKKRAGRRGPPNGEG
jgi:membrane protein